MANRPPEITFSVGLLEKLAGLKKPEPLKPSVHRPPPIQLPIRGPISGEAARLIAQDKQLTRQLQATKEVAGVLLKHEESELQLVQAKAAELLKQYSYPSKPLPCQAESTACLQCFKDNAAEAWRCSSLAEAYRQCANSALVASGGVAVK